MEQFIIIEQSKADLSAIIEQVKNGSSVVIANNGKHEVKITPIEDKPKRKLNVGFLREQYPNVKIPENFDRIFEDEIYAMFAGEYDENPN